MMTNGAMLSIASAMMKHAVDGNCDKAIEKCIKILEELNKRKGEKNGNEVSA